jgi:hypothetical protein
MPSVIFEHRTSQHPRGINTPLQLGNCACSLKPINAQANI